MAARTTETDTSAGAVVSAAVPMSVTVLHTVERSRRPTRGAPASPPRWGSAVVALVREDGGAVGGESRSAQSDNKCPSVRPKRDRNAATLTIQCAWRHPDEAHTLSLT